MEHWSDEVDQSALDWEALKVRCMGNLALVERVLAKFTGQLDADLIELERAIRARDATEAAQVAHRIKGTAGSVSARDLYENASRAEQRALDMQLAELPHDLERMRLDRTKLRKTIERMKQPS
ncbi:MAG TPA: Hpt domain-containing protein [Pirellulales bacterium]|jgi:HPt (histidine-containing phosphotransfer) domain-containing protein|nr:Hpt domain-containing protein [Pirellulales bacterium]